MKINIQEKLNPFANDFACILCVLTLYQTDGIPEWKACHERRQSIINLCQSN